MNEIKEVRINIYGWVDFKEGESIMEIDNVIKERESQKMKWKKFSENMPYLGTNILVTDGKGAMSIVEFDLHSKDYIERKQWEQGGCYLLVTHFDNAEEDNEYDMQDFPYWCYPSDIAVNFLD